MSLIGNGIQLTNSNFSLNNLSCKCGAKWCFENNSLEYKPAPQPKETKQKPVAWQWLTTAHFRKKLPKDAEVGAWNPLYTTPPQRKPLTPEQIAEFDCYDHFKFARAIEAAHGIKE